MKHHSAASFDKVSTSVTKDTWKGFIGLNQSTGSDDICICFLSPALTMFILHALNSNACKMSKKPVAGLQTGRLPHENTGLL